MELQSQNPSNTSHVRFDYDPEVKAHSPSHLQLSGLHEFRIPANYFPQPLAFIQLCEMTYASERTLLAEDMAFEKRHVLMLQPSSDLISLAWSAADQ
jgi:acyl-CoA thioesterase